MLKLTKKADYGLMALKFLAEHPEKPALSAKDVADAYGIPAQLLAKILQQLTKSGLLRSQAGMNGGYVHQGQDGLRADTKLHHQGAAGAGQRDYCRRFEEHQHPGPRGARTPGPWARGASVGCFDFVMDVFAPR
jgi:hypothetical protein